MSPQWARMSHLVPHDPEHELEWSIIADSIDEDELRRLRELHSIVEDCDLHPACQRKPLHRQAQTLLRYLRGRDGNVCKAEKMFREMLDWRDRFDVENKVHAWRRELERGRTRRARLCKVYGVEEQMCNDKYGIPVRLFRLSVADTAGLIREFGVEAVLVDSLSKLEWTHEQVRKAMFKHQKLIRGQVQIIDVGDYGEVPDWTGRMWNNLRLGPDIYKVFDGNYPETVRKVFIVRASSLVHKGFMLIQGLLPQRTKRKLKLYGPKAEEWVSELCLELPDTHELPEFLLNDSEHAIRSAKPKGGIVPEGIAGPNQGRFEEEDGTSPVTTCSTPAKLTPTSGKKQIEVTRDFLGSLCQILVAAAAALMLTILRGRFMQDTH